jgi:hypothetical protein
MMRTAPSSSPWSRPANLYIFFPHGRPTRRTRPCLPQAERAALGVKDGSGRRVGHPAHPVPRHGGGAAAIRSVLRVARLF